MGIKSSGDGGHTIEDEGVPLTKRTKLNFVGAGVSVADDAGDDASDVTITGSGAGEANIQVKLYNKIVITNFAVNAVINTNGSDCNSAIRDDGVDVPNTTVTITAGVPALYEATGLTETIVAGSLMNLRQKGAGTTASLRTEDTVRFRNAS